MGSTTERAEPLAETSAGASGVSLPNADCDDATVPPENDPRSSKG
jgi:hypothetical protein